MPMIDSARRVCFCVVLFLAGGLAAAPAHAQKKSTEPAKEPPTAAASASDRPNFAAALQYLEWRDIGPAIMGGRIDDFAVVESDPNIVYVGAASGGVWKTTNGGTTWEPVFDKEAVSTIGDVTLGPSDPSLVWVGSGEPNNRQSSSWGNGVYKSTDAGKTWANVGLGDSHHVGRIVIHPANPDVVYVAALGHLWGPNKERGVYKTTDGGKTWTRSLFINEDTGAVDMAMDPESPDTLYAAAYERRRTPFGFNGGGPDGGLYKTTDGGATWKKLTKGLPYAEGGDVGRIGISIYRRNPNIVYAIVQHQKGGVFRSEDKGENWTKMGDTNPRPSYYSQIVIDPNNDLRIWVLGAPMYYSEDGGKTFVTNRVTRIHGDYHAMWINPKNSNHMIVGSDGGIHWSYDGGRTWEYLNSVPLGQFYELGVDMRKPYWICGGLQDNGSWCGPSATLFQQGITNDDWFRVAGGDGFYVQVDPTDAAIVYAESQDGNVLRRDLRTNEARTIRPEPKEGEPRYRFQWNSPIVISAHEPKTIYYGGNFLFKSTDRGDTWTKLGGDLTTGVDRSKLPILGKVPDAHTLSRHDGAQEYPTITTISESPLTTAVLWVGTDDGNLQATRDAGQNWKNVTEKVPGVPKGTYISRVVASRYDEGTAYVAFDGHRSNDFHVYVFMTTDYGETWKSLSGALSAKDGTVHVIREHPRNQNLLFLGTEYGGYVSLDRGANWISLKTNLPTVPVDDIAIHPRENDLIFGTHGRSVWVLDDITPLENLDSKVLNSALHLFDIRPATAWRLYGNKGNTGHKFYIAHNPPYGALISFYLKSMPEEKESVKLTILDKDGKTVRELTCGGGAPGGARGAGAPGPGAVGPGLRQLPCEPRPGINRINWDLRYTTPAEPTPEQREAAAQGFGFGPRGPMVEPGEYTVKVTAGKSEASKTFTVEEDPRIVISPSDRATRRTALTQLYELAKTADRGQKTITGLKNSLTAAMESWKQPGAPSVPENIRKAAESLAKQVEEIHGKFVAPQQPTGSAGPPLQYAPPPFWQRVGRLMTAIEGYTAAPTSQQMDEFQTLSKLLGETMERLRKLVDDDLANLNKMMNEAGIPHIRVAPPEGARERGRR
jgi:photosystem II stability/assembly factor-like uncharacterized protein